MSRKKSIFFILLVLVAVFAITVTTVMAKRPSITDETVTWRLSRTTVISPGQTTELKEGTLITGYVIESRARAPHPRLVPNGVFHLEMTVFRPNQDMPGQEAGKYYVRGDWSITRANANKASTKLRHSPDVIAGKILAELAFDPTIAGNAWSAEVSLPMSTAAGQWSRGLGTISLDEKQEGDLFLDVKLWPEMP